MKKLIALLCILSALVLIVSCDNSTASSGTTIETISWDPDGSGYRQFSTNDDQYYNYYFTYTLSSPDQNPMTTVEVNVKKISGYQHQSYGIIFCRLDSNNYNYLLITINGVYYVGEIVGGTDYEIINWTSTGNLATGLSTDNNIEITYTQATNTFSISFNGFATASFGATRSGGKSGYFASVGDGTDENFPDTPVDIRFKRVLPLPVDP